jgi:hypothetical protein
VISSTSYFRARIVSGIATLLAAPIGAASMRRPAMFTLLVRNP